MDCDLCVVGGGLAGVCSAIAAAREGLRVTLIQDRPVLGGNASSEVRLWVLGATAHMRSPNRWAREPGVIDELLVENMWRNREGNPLIFDTILLEWAQREANLTTLLNTSMFDVDKHDAGRIRSVRAWCSQNQTMHRIAAPLFVDASGDGVLGFQAGAAFRLGAESQEEFGERFAPDRAYGELLGQSMYFYSKDAGQPVRYVPPAFALRDIEGTIPRYRDFKANEDGCRLWWIEYGGRLDPVHDTERIKWELWRVVYGVWDYIKNSGRFPREEVDNLTLEWVGTVPGKREARRFEGDYILNQHDVIERRPHADTVAFGGWALDLHPADGVYSEFENCTHWRMPGIYPIPYRCLYSRNVRNLFLAGRCISASHVAFGSTRVMGTLALCGQAVGVAAAVCREQDAEPAALHDGGLLHTLQARLHRTGQHMPGVHVRDDQDIAPEAMIDVSSTHRFTGLAPGQDWQSLRRPIAQLIPLAPGPLPTFRVPLRATQNGRARVELRCHDQPACYIPKNLLAETEVELCAGQTLEAVLSPTAEMSEGRYGFLIIRGDEGCEVRLSDQRLTGFLSVIHGYTQDPPEDIGVDRLEVWHPQRRPGGRNLAVRVEPGLACFQSEFLVNGVFRPVDTTNAWCADPADPHPTLTLTWPERRRVRRIVIHLDTDWDHAMESVLLGHPEAAMPMCVRDLDLRDDQDRLIAEVRDNHQTRVIVEPEEPLNTQRIELRGLRTHSEAPPAVFGIQCY